MFQLWRLGEFFKPTNYVFLALTSVDFLRGLTGFEFYLYYFNYEETFSQVTAITFHYIAESLSLGTGVALYLFKIVPIPS